MRGLVVFCVACTGGDSARPAPVEAQILDLTDYTLLDADADPLADHRPEAVDCGPRGLRIESEQLEINTERCTYAAVQFEALQDVPQGTPIRATVFHTGLWAPEPATAHVAWLLGGDVVWEATPPIPEDTAFYLWEGLLPVALETGDPVLFHLHNHGINDWTASEFIRLDAD